MPIKEKTLKTLFDLFIDNEDLTTELLKNNGIDYKLVKHLIKYGIIKKVGYGHYQIVAYNKLEMYAVELEKKGDKRRASLCLEKLKTLREKRTSVEPDLAKIFDLYLEQKPLTSQNLLGIGFSQSDIKRLCNNGYIQKITDESYHLLRIADLYSYADKLKKKGDLKKSKLCYKMAIMAEKDEKRLNVELGILCDILLNSGKITTRKAYEAGITSSRFSTLQNLGYMKKNSEGIFTLTSSHLLLQHCQKVEEEGNIELAYKGYEICCDIEFNMRLCFKLGLYFCTKKDFEKGVTYFGRLKSTQNLLCRAMYNYYLFLLSFVILLPKGYRNYVQKINFSDIIFPINILSPEEQRKDDEFKNAIYKQKFASIMPNEFEFKDDEFDFDWYSLSRELLPIIQKNHIITRNKLRTALANHDIDAFINTLTSEYQFHPLTPEYDAFLTIAKDIRSLTENRTLTVPATSSEDESLSDLIHNRQYKKAHLKASQKAAAKNIAPEQNILLELLNWVNRELDNSKKTSKCPTQEIKLQVSDHRVPKSQPNPIYNELNHLLLSDLREEALLLVREYLHKNDLTTYCYLIESLIKISFASGDTDFMIPIGTFIKVTKGTFEMEIDRYIGLFEDSLKSNNTYVAKMYLNLLIEIGRRGHSDYPTVDHQKIVADLKKKLSDSSMQGNKHFINALPKS